MLSGKLLCTKYNNNLTIQKKQTMRSKNYDYHHGTSHLHNNIHQIKALKKSVTLHFYSDNPEKGEVFDI